MSLRSGVWAVVFTDMVDSTAQRARLGDAPADALRRAHDAIADRAVRRYAGEFVKGTGDGAMLAFPSAADAVAAAVDIQRGVVRHNTESSEPIHVRVGISLGEVECEANDLFGLAVNEAARVCGLANAGEIVISDIVRVVAGSRLDIPLEDRGLIELKGIPAPIAVWSIGWESGPELEVVAFPSLLDSGRQPPFQGRSRELARLLEAWAESVHGSCRAVFVSGEPGIGKTRLAAEFARRAHADGATVVYGACDEALAAPFQPFAEALDWYCEHALVASFGRYPDDLARLSDRVSDRFTRRLEPMRAEAETERQRLFEAVTLWLSAEAEVSPLVLVVDDLHWATRETLAMLRYVLRGVADKPLFVVATYRDTDLNRVHPLSEMLGEFSRLGTVDRVALSGLDTPDVLDLLRSFLDLDQTANADADASALAASIHTETDGNAFFVNEVLRNLADTHTTAAIPQGVRDAVGQRLNRLGDDATTVLRAAAVAGGTFTLSSVVAAAGVSDDDAVDVLERACAAHLTEEIGANRFRFAHALVRSTLLDETSITRRLRMHRAIAASLEHTDPTNVTDLAYHWCAASEAGDVDKAVRYSIAAAEHAMTHTAYDDARAIAQRALELVDRDETLELSLLVERGRAEVAIGDPVAYRATYQRIADLATNAGDNVTYAEAVLGYVGRDETLTDLDDFARNGLERSLAVLDRTTQPELVGRLLGALASGVTNWEPERADRLSLEALTLARDAGSRDMFIHAARARLRCWWDPNATEERLALAAELRAAAAQAGKPEDIAQAGQWEAILRLEIADLAAMKRTLDETDRINETLNLQYFRWATTARRGAIALSIGNLDDAEQLITEAAALTTHDFNIFTIQFAVLRWLQGRVHEIVDLILGDQEGDQSGTAMGYQAFFALAAAESGRTDAAADTLRRLFGEGLRRPDGDLGYTVFLSSAARAARLIGPGPWIDPLQALCQPLAGRFAVVNPGCSSLGAIDGSRGSLALAAGRNDDAIRILTAAVQQNRAARLRPFVALSQADLAAAYAASGDTAAAKTHATQARELANEIGMVHITRQLDDLTY